MIYCVPVHIREYGCDNDQYDYVYLFECIDDANDCISELTNHVDYPIGDNLRGEFREWYPSNVIKCDDINHVNQTFDEYYNVIIYDINEFKFTP